MITRKDLSDEQELALQAMLDFVDSNGRQMVLSGYAGVGKTSLVNIFLQEVKKKYSYKPTTCTAPTNEAVRVLNGMSNKGYDATIYSLLGLALVEEDGRKPYLKQAGNSKLDEYDLIIVDEASMVGDELLNKIEEQLKEHSFIQIIYVGDIGQLPPINTQKDEANQLMRGEEEQTESKVFQLKNKVTLTQVQRCSADNPIIKTVTAIRENFESPVDLFERKTELIEENESGIEFMDNRDTFMDQMFKDFESDNYKKDNNYVRAIAYTNKAVDALNLHIRRRIFQTNELNQFMVGENLMVASPVMKKVNPRVSVIMFTVGERIRVKRATIVTDPEYGFRVWNLTVENYEAKKPETHVMSVIHEGDIKIYRDTLKDLAADAKERAVKKISDQNGKRTNMFSRGEAWRVYYAFKNEYSWVKYAYAMTTHRSQGSTIRRVYVVERDMNRLSWNNVIRNKLKYTAFTRASHLLRILQ